MDQIIRLCEINAHRSTVVRVVHSLGYRGRFAAKKPFMSSKNAKACFLWCKERVHWTTDGWAKVIWSDETSVEIGEKAWKGIHVGSCRRTIHEDCLCPTFKSGCKSVQTSS